MAKKLLALVMALLLLVGCSTVAFARVTDSMCVVNCQEWVSLRSSPSTSSSQLARVPLGAWVTGCESADNGFIRCEYNGQTGYVLAKYLNEDAGGAEESDEVSSTMHVVNCQSWVSLRSSASTGAAQLAKVPLGATVTNCSAASNGFIKCSYDGQTGYILARYLREGAGNDAVVEPEPTPSITPEPDQPDINAGDTMQVVNCQSWVSLRKLPSTSSTQLARVPLGATVTDCSAADNGFVRCIYNGQAGYILTSYLRAVDDSTGDNATAAPEVTEIPDATETPDATEAPAETPEPTAAPEQDASNNMYVVNCQSWVSLRSSPSTSASQLARVPLGTEVVNCSAASNGFIKCSYLGQTGYILAEYLSTELGELKYDGIVKEMNAAGYRVTVERGNDGYDESIRVRCYSSSGAMLWEHEADNGYATELTLTNAFIGGSASDPRVMLYVESEGLSALNIRTGERIWLLPSSEVNLGSICWAVAEDGTMYIGGYYGPDPVAISVDGKVLWQSDSMENGPYWLYKIELTDEGVLASYDMNVDYGAGAQILYGYDGSLLEYIPED